MVLRLQDFGIPKAARLLAPALKWRITQVGLDLCQRRSRRPDPLPLHQHDSMVEIIDAIQRRKSAKAEVPIGPEHRKLWPPIRRQRYPMLPHTVEQIGGQSTLRHHRDIDVAVSPAEAAMSKAADEIDSQEL